MHVHLTSEFAFRKLSLRVRFAFSKLHMVSYLPVRPHALAKVAPVLVGNSFLVADATWVLENLLNLYVVVSFEAFHLFLGWVSVIVGLLFVSSQKIG